MMNLEKQLMILVESVVMPLRASGKRKDKMRKELLAHLYQIHEESVAQGEDDSVALQSIKKRFGDPAELRKELQDSVPFMERLLFVRIPFISHLEPFCQGWLTPRPGETPLDHSFRITGGMVALYSVVICAAFAIRFIPDIFIQLIRNGAFFWTGHLDQEIVGSLMSKIRIATGVMAALATQTFFILLIGHRISRLTEKRPISLINKIQAGFLSLACLVPLCLGVLILGATVQNDLNSSFLEGWQAKNVLHRLGGLLVIAPFIINYVIFSLQRKKQRRQWEELELAE